MMDDVVGYVGRRAVWIEHRQGRRAPGLVREMIQDALGDTFAGIVKWAPARCSLALHLKTVVCSRLSREFDRAEQFHHINVADASEADAHEALGGDAKPADPQLDECVDQFEKRLRLLADNDKPVLALLDVYLEGTQDQPEREQRAARCVCGGQGDHAAAELLPGHRGLAAQPCVQVEHAFCDPVDAPKLSRLAGISLDGRDPVALGARLRLEVAEAGDLGC